MPPGALPADRKQYHQPRTCRAPDSPASCGVNCFDGHRFNNYKAQSHTPDMIITDYMTTEWKKRT